MESVTSIVRRMFTTIRGRVSSHPDMTAALREHLPPAPELIGMTHKEFETYLQAQFQPGMTWYNWGRDDGCWQIDHVIALSQFDVKDLSQVRHATHWSNLQPMLMDDNMNKYNYLPNTLDGLHHLRLVYADPPSLLHLPLCPVPHLSPVVLPVHDALTQLRISYAFADRGHRYQLPPVSLCVSLDPLPVAPVVSVCAATASRSEPLPTLVLTASPDPHHSIPHPPAPNVGRNRGRHGRTHPTPPAATLPVIRL
jgi:hypothetical protein